MEVPTTGRILTFARQIFFAVVVGILIGTVVIVGFEEKFIFFPSTYSARDYESGLSIPNLRECRFETEDGIRLHGWFAPADTPVATLVVSHGNAGNIANRAEIIRRLQRTGFNVFMYDYRGYGMSEGTPDEEGIYRDGRAAFDYGLTLPGVDADRIVLWGTSLGGAVAVDVATRRPAAALILESTFSSAKEMAGELYPFLPVGLFLRSEFNSIEKIREVTVPVLSMHGSRDGIIPPALGKKLFEAANEPKQFYEIAGADHNDTYLVGGEEYLRQARDFVIRHVGPG